MIKALIKKEWKKSKNIIILFAILCIFSLAYIVFDIKNLIEYMRPSDALQEIINKGVLNLSYIKNFIMILGGVLAFTQFYPEVSNARIRLHLHLPMNQNFLIHTFIFYGLSIIILFSLISNLIFFLSIIVFFPIEVFYAFETILFEAFIISTLAYFCIAIFLINPSKNIKVAIFLLSLLIGMLYQEYVKGFFVAQNLYYYFCFIFITYYTLLFNSFKTYAKGYVK